MMQCAREGLLVGTEFPLLEPDASALTEADVQAGRFQGCSRTRCSRCDRPVMHFPARVFLVRPTPQELEAAYDQSSLERFLGTDRFSPHYRAYACRCDITIVRGWLSLRNAYRDRDLAWICRGHG